ncbi:MAG: cupredoxin family protein [Collimonas sp.]|uniref:cupredoxin domain-containing protein n=1 Tax=Collimonas sp. TaxID=1963772 RepID=UPI0032673F9E
MKISLVTPLLCSGLLALSSAAHADTGHHHADGAAALGQPGIVVDVTHTVKIDMADNMRFTPANIRVKQGETVKFLVVNNGKLKHEMVIGSPAQLAEHAALMRKMPEMEHEDDNQVSVAPGASGELIWKFDRAGTVDFACLQAGHYEAGMKGQIVASAGNADAQ